MKAKSCMEHQEFSEKRYTLAATQILGSEQNLHYVKFSNCAVQASKLECHGCIKILAAADRLTGFATAAPRTPRRTRITRRPRVYWLTTVRRHHRRTVARPTVDMTHTCRLCSVALAPLD